MIVHEKNLIKLAKVIFKKQIPNEKRQKYGATGAVIGFTLNILLFIGKFIAGYVSGSISVTADAFNNLSDAGSSAMVFLGFKFAGMKADEDHPYGHGRIEYIAGLCVSMVILLMGFELAKTSIGEIFSPTVKEGNNVTLIVLVVAMAVKLFMFFFYNVIGIAIDSTTLKVSATDSISDVLSTFAVFVCWIINTINDVALDGYAGLAVSLIILYSGYNAAKETISPLLGRAPTDEFVNSVKEIVLSHEGISGIHGLNVHDYGPGRVLITLHARIPPEANAVYVHTLLDSVEHELHEKLGCEAVIHADPCNEDDEKQ